MKTTDLRLTSDDVKVVQNAKGPTFRPLGGMKYRCNQLEHLGVLTHRQAQHLKRACWPRHRGNVAQSEPAVRWIKLSAEELAQDKIKKAREKRSQVNRSHSYTFTRVPAHSWWDW